MIKYETFKLRFYENSKIKVMWILGFVDLSTKLLHKWFHWSLLMEYFLGFIIIVISVLIITPSAIFIALIKSIKKIKKLNK